LKLNAGAGVSSDLLQAKATIKNREKNLVCILQKFKNR
jgi:hypothetical protein